VLRITRTITILISALIFISCGGWASKEKSEFIQECKGGSDKEELIRLCKCVYKVVSSEFSYEEYKIMSELDFNSFSNSDNNSLKEITPDIKSCY